MKVFAALLFAVLTAQILVAQPQESTDKPDTAKAAAHKDKAKKEPGASPEKSESKPAEPARSEEATDKEEHFDVSEVPAVVTHHTMTVNGKALAYTATAGRLPLKRADGKIEAEMFFVAYTLDGQDAAKRPLTFAFNGGPGSASVWLHMGALGPKRVVLQQNGFMPAAPYRVEDNQRDAATGGTRQEEHVSGHSIGTKDGTCEPCFGRSPVSGDLTLS